MKIVIAPDTFKGSLSAVAVADAVREGMARILPDADFDLVPMADGGEGTVDALVAATGGERGEATVSGPDGRPVRACFGLIGGDTAVVEVAQASGLGLVAPEARDPGAASTRGTGELVLAALRHAGGSPLRRLIIGLGGSATNDGGAGFCQALGVRFYDRSERLLDAPLGGADLGRVARMDTAGLDPRLAGLRIEAASDVDNPLLGPAGATATFGPQKGASPAQVTALDAALGTFYRLVTSTLGRDVTTRAGAGAAGGLGAALLAFLNAELRPGIDIVMEAARLESRLRGATVVITGEGRVDRQTFRGKAPLGVARLARRCGVPVIALGGSLDAAAHELLDGELDALEAAVCHPMREAEALADARALLVRAAMRTAAWLCLARSLRRES